MCSCGCTEKCCASYICDGGKCKNPDVLRSVPLLRKLRIDGQRVYTQRTQEIIDAIHDLLEKFCHALQAVNRSSLVLRSRAFFPLLKEGTSASECLKSNFVDRLYQYIMDRAEWMTKDRLKEFTKAVDCHEACTYLDEIELWIDKLTDVNNLVRAESIRYPSHCHRTSMDHYLFIVDEAFENLPFSAFYSLHCRVQEKICRREQAHVFVSFATFL